MYSLSRLTLLLSVLGLTGCALFVPPLEVIDVVAPVVPVTLTATLPVPQVTPTERVGPTSASESSPTPLLLATATVTTERTLPASSQPPIPVLPPSATATPTPIVAIFLTPTAEWQPVQVGYAIIEIPMGWVSLQIPGGGDQEAFFESVDLNALPPSIPLDDGYAWISYTEWNPEPSPEEWATFIVDGYSAKYNLLTDSDFSVNPIWLGVLHINTPERKHIITLRCSAPATLGEPRQREYHAYCESIIQQWIETTQILD